MKINFITKAFLVYIFIIGPIATITTVVIQPTTINICLLYFVNLVLGLILYELSTKYMKDNE